MARAADLLGDRWTLLILREAFYGVVRYDDMLADLGAPRSMLTDRLKKLVEHGLMARRTYKEPNARARQAYILTEAGRSLGPTFMALTEWSETHLMKQPAPVEFVEIGPGTPVMTRLVGSEGSIVPLSRVGIQRRK